MEQKTVKLIDKKNNNIYTFNFINRSESTYNGFKHTTQLFINNKYIGSYKINYINRTWEFYTYQSVMSKSLNSIIEDRTEQLKEKFKNVYNIKRISNKYRFILNKYINDDELINIYKLVNDKIKLDSSMYIEMYI